LFSGVGIGPLAWGLFDLRAQRCLVNALFKFDVDFEPRGVIMADV